MTGLIINEETPTAKLVTMGQGDKEMPKKEEVSFETHPELYHLPSGATEPVLKNPDALDSTAGAEVIKKEPADKQGPVGAKGKPKTTNKK